MPANPHGLVSRLPLRRVLGRVPLGLGDALHVLLELRTEGLHAVADEHRRLVQPAAQVREGPLLLGCQIFPHMKISAEVAEQDVELAVAVVVGHGDLRADAGLRVLAGLEQLAIADPLVFRDEGDRWLELRTAAPPGVAVPVDAAVGGAGDDVPAPVAVPVDDHRVGMFAAGHAQRLGADLDPLVPGRVGGLLARPLVAPEEDQPVVGADQDIEVAVVVPVDERRPAPERLDRLLLVGDLEDRLAALVLDHLGGRERPVPPAPEQVQGAGVIRARDQVEGAVAVEVHQLWTGADASVDRHLRVDTARLEVDRRRVSRLPVRALVAVEAEQPAEVADDQVARGRRRRCPRPRARNGPTRRRCRSRRRPPRAAPGHERSPWHCPSARRSPRHTAPRPAPAPGPRTPAGRRDPGPLDRVHAVLPSDSHPWRHPVAFLGQL